MDTVKVVACASASLDAIGCRSVVLVAMDEHVALPVTAGEKGGVEERDNAMVVALGALRFSVGSLAPSVQRQARFIEYHRALDELLALYLIENPGALPTKLGVLDLCQWAFEQTGLRPGSMPRGAGPDE